MKIMILAVISLFSLTSMGKEFNVDKLPHGKGVTLPASAAISVKAFGRVMFGSTDLPQSLKLTSFNKHRGKVPSVQLIIKSRDKANSRSITIRPGSPVIYNFDSLGLITMTFANSGASLSGVRLRVDSDKPLEIRR